MFLFVVFQISADW